MMISISRLMSFALTWTIATAKKQYNNDLRADSIDMKVNPTTDLGKRWIRRKRVLQRWRMEESSGDLEEIFDKNNEEPENKALPITIDTTIITDSPTESPSCLSPTNTPTLSPTHTATLTPTKHPTKSPTPKSYATPTKVHTAVPISFPTHIPQRTTTISCPFADMSVESGNMVEERVTVNFTYNVETNTTTIDKNVEQAIINELGSSITSSIVKDHCTGSRLLLRTTSHRRLEITGVISDPQDYKTGICEPKKAKSQSCTSFQGSVTVLYTKEEKNKTPQEIEQNTLGTIEENMNNGEYIEDVNEGLDGIGVNVTNIAYTSPDEVPILSAANTEEVTHQNRTYITPGGRTAIAFFVLVFLVVNFLLCFCCWKKQKPSSMLKDSPQTNESKSLSSGSGTYENSAEEENSYITSDYNDLGQHHSKQDVHRCQSATCNMCRPILPSNGPLATIDENDQLQGDGDVNDQTRTRNEPTGKKSVRFLRIQAVQIPVHDGTAGDIDCDDASDLTSLDDSFFHEDNRSRRGYLHAEDGSYGEI